MDRFAWRLILIPLAMALSGCGSSQGIQVSGKLSKGGAKYSLPADQRLNITFHVMDDSARGTQSYMAVYKPEDGTFTVGGPDGNGIPPGKYRVSLEQLLTREAVDKKNENAKAKKKIFFRDTDMLDGKYGEGSPIVVEIKDSSEVTIDLDKVPKPAAAGNASG